MRPIASEVVRDRIASGLRRAQFWGGGVGEPCVAPLDRPYFRLGNPAKRGQMSKIAAAAFLPTWAIPGAVRPRP